MLQQFKSLLRVYHCKLEVGMPSNLPCGKLEIREISGFWGEHIVMLLDFSDRFLIEHIPMVRYETLNRPLLDIQEDFPLHSSQIIDHTNPSNGTKHSQQ